VLNGLCREGNTAHQLCHPDGQTEKKTYFSLSWRGEGKKKVSTQKEPRPAPPVHVSERKDGNHERGHGQGKEEEKSLHVCSFAGKETRKKPGVDESPGKLAEGEEDDKEKEKGKGDYPFKISSWGEEKRIKDQPSSTKRPRARKGEGGPLCCVGKRGVVPLPFCMGGDLRRAGL